MDSSIWVAILGTLGTLITVSGTIIVALISKNTNKKVSKIEDVKDYCQEMIDKHILENDKTYLTDFLSDIESGEPKKEIQIRRAYEIKEEYNKKGGDSYVDDKWEELAKKGVLKERRQEV